MPIVEIEALDDDGFGIARYKGKVLRIAGALPGEKVKLVSLPRGDKSVAFPEAVLEESPDRVRPLCPLFGLCGGCRLQHLKYPAQLRFKESKVRKYFDGIDVDYFESILPSPKVFRYRNKMEFAVGETRERLAIGLKAYGRFDRLVDIHSCLLHKQEADAALRALREYLEEKGLKGYNILLHKGFVRYIVLRSTFKTDNLMVILVTRSSNSVNVDEIREISRASSVIWVINDSLSDVAKGEIREISGKEHIVEELLGLKFLIGPFSFFQPNPLQAERMFAIVRNLADEGKFGLDLYSGIGTIALLVAEKFEEIYGVEIVEEAVEYARRNAELNNISNVKFFASPVERFMPKLERTPDVVFLDPPRAGVAPKVLRKIIKLAPQRILYVSCNPKTMSRDIRILQSGGYKVMFLRPVDMFPHTPHVEAVALLELNK